MFSRNKLFVCLLISASALLAQTPTATITGIVTDPSQAAIAGAIVVVRNTGTNISHSILTSKAGEYTAPLLPVGPYDVSVEAVGFKKSVENNITLQVDQVARLDFTLAIGRASETVEVTSQLPAVQTDSSEVGQVVDNTKVVEMPLNGRQFYSLATLVPGAYPPVQNSTLSFRGGINEAG